MYLLVEDAVSELNQVYTDVIVLPLEASAVSGKNADSTFLTERKMNIEYEESVHRQLNSEEDGVFVVKCRTLFLDS